MILLLNNKQTMPSLLILACGFLRYMIDPFIPLILLFLNQLHLISQTLSQNHKNFHIHIRRRRSKCMHIIFAVISAFPLAFLFNRILNFFDEPLILVKLLFLQNVFCF